MPLASRPVRPTLLSLNSPFPSPPTPLVTDTRSLRKLSSVSSHTDALTSGGGFSLTLRLPITFRIKTNTWVPAALPALLFTPLPVLFSPPSSPPPPPPVHPHLPLLLTPTSPSCSPRSLFTPSPLPHSQFTPPLPCSPPPPPPPHSAHLLIVSWNTRFFYTEVPFPMFCLK